MTATPPISSLAFLAPVFVLLSAYVLIVFERADRAVIAMLGAVLLVLLGVASQNEALSFVDFNTLGLLAGMMIIVSIARKSGLFSYAAISAAQLVRASPAGMLAVLSLVTAVLSAFVNNVTVVLLIAPVTFVVCDELRITPYPYLLAQIFASNIGGTATLIGDPPNILIGSATGLSFIDFAVNLGPVVAAALALQIVATHVIWGSKLKASAEDRGRVMAIRARETIEDRYLLLCSLVVILAVVAALVGAGRLHLQPAAIAAAGAAVLLLLESFPHDHSVRDENVAAALGQIDWAMLIFLAGLFVMIGALAKAGVLDALGHILLAGTGHDVRLAAGCVLWLSALLSAIVDNVPYVAAMIPLVKGIAPGLGGTHAVTPLWWSLALGAGFGGNATLIGASANLTVASLAGKNGVRISFFGFARAALPLTVASVALVHLYLMWRYF